MKREDLIKLITDNFAEGEEVSFRYCDDQGDIVSTKAFFDIDTQEYIEDGYWTIFDANHNVIRDHISHEDIDKDVARFGHMYGSSEWTTTKKKTVTTKVIDVAG